MNINFTTYSLLKKCFRSKRVQRPPPPEVQKFSTKVSANPDYTGFAHMLHSDEENEHENLDGDNLSLIDEIDAALPSQMQKEKRPNRKPPKPPGK